MTRRLHTAIKIIYGTGDAASNLIWTATGTFLMLYYTDVALISAASVGTIMMISRILDGISDLTMGWIIDKTHTRMGKARPWFILSAPFLCISLVMVFGVPEEFGNQGKVIYAAVTYIFICAIAYTASNLSYSVLCNLMTTSTREN